ncbi:fish-egg lectin-like [Acipenser ruthenus]|uniref:fish-egg lectin-like n=1 Tax=Acipenser ruthenus TaxID=7906 RepID=UPI0027429813|nr:fish-egg lectin-like [Acipenser ruthenus]
MRTLAFCLILVMGSSEALDCQFVDGSLKQVDAGLGLVFGVNDAGAVFMRFGNKWVLMEGNLRHVTVGPAGLWGVNEDFHIFKMVAGKWERVEGLLKQIDAGGDQLIGGVNNESAGFCLNQQGAALVLGGGAHVPWVSLADDLVYYSCGPQSCWGVTSKNAVLVRKGVTPNKCQGSDWEPVPDFPMVLVEVGSDGIVFGINGTGEVFRRAGITDSNPSGSQWTHQYVCGNMRHASYDLGVLWLITMDQKIVSCIL